MGLPGALSWDQVGGRTCSEHAGGERGGGGSMGHHRHKNDDDDNLIVMEHGAQHAPPCARRCDEVTWRFGVYSLVIQ